jgi:hypothetical protein
MMYDFTIYQAHRGYRPVYRTGAHCPGCARAKWIVGRFSAECAACGTALPLAPAEASPAVGVRYPAWGNRA